MVPSTLFPTAAAATGEAPTSATAASAAADAATATRFAALMSMLAHPGRITTREGLSQAAPTATLAGEAEAAPSAEALKAREALRAFVEGVTAGATGSDAHADSAADQSSDASTAAADAIASGAASSPTAHAQLGAVDDGIAVAAMVAAAASGSSAAASADASGIAATELAATSAKPSASSAEALRPVRDLEALHPELRIRVERVISRMASEHGHSVSVVETYRSEERQAALHAKGRSAPGEIVTWTMDSLHTQGRAADLVVDGDWSNTAAYERLQRIAREEGLTTLGMKDAGHVELREGALAGASAKAGGRAGLAPRASAVATAAATSSTATPFASAGASVAAPAAPAVVGAAAVATPAIVARVATVALVHEPGSKPIAASSASAAAMSATAATPATPTASPATAAAPALSSASESAMGTPVHSATSDDASAPIPSDDTSRGALGGPATGTAAASRGAELSLRTSETRPVDEELESSDLTDATAMDAAASADAERPAFELRGRTERSAGSGTTTGTDRIDGPRVSERLDRIEALAEAKRSQPLQSLTLRVEDEAGRDHRIRVDLRGDSVAADIAVARSSEVSALTRRLPELAQRLGEHGYEASALQVRTLTTESSHASDSRHGGEGRDGQQQHAHQNPHHRHRARREQEGETQ